jgi:hypothetical protein
MIWDDKENQISDDTLTLKMLNMHEDKVWSWEKKPNIMRISWEGSPDYN